MATLVEIMEKMTAQMILNYVIFPSVTENDTDKTMSWRTGHSQSSVIFDFISPGSSQAVREGFGFAHVQYCVFLACTVKSLECSFQTC